MKKIIAAILFFTAFARLYGNVSDYTFSQSVDSFVSIHISGTYIAGGCTSTVFGNLPIGFTFQYNNIPYTQFGLCCSGWISMGPAVPLPSPNPLSSGVTNNVISPFGAQLTSTVAGNGIYYKTEGISPNRIMTVEWWQYGFWLNGFDEVSFQIKLYETTNQIRFVYTTNDEYSIRTVQVGLRGAANTDFNNRQTTTNWLQTTAGNSNTASCTFQQGITPPAGLTFIFTPHPVSVVHLSNEIPGKFSLFQNYPNPFNPQTKIKFDVPQNVKSQTSNVKLVVYDLLGREAATLVNEELTPGTYQADWDASNFSSGVYFCKITAGDFVETKKMVLMK